MTHKALTQAIAGFHRVRLAHLPTPLEEMKNLGSQLDLALYVKRDDCTGIGFGGNKIRQLEFYFGAAVAQKADTILITGAVQSNYARATAAMARRLGMACHIQVEERYPNPSALHRSNGNVLLDHLLGATLHSFPDGEDEAGADAALQDIAQNLKTHGHRPYVIPLAATHPPLGALGYVEAACELAEQLRTFEHETGTEGLEIDEIIVPSGTGFSHAGLLFGLKVLGLNIPVRGICVRRNAKEQEARVRQRLQDLSTLLKLPAKLTPHFTAAEIRCYDGSLAPGYGQLNPATQAAIAQTAQTEGLFLDPVYTGKTMAGLMALAKARELAGSRIIFWHTGGAPALFAYADQLV